MQQAVNATIKEKAFSMGPLRDYVNSSVVDQKSVVEREWEWSESSAVKKEEFGWRFIVSYSNWLWLRQVVQEGVNKSNHPVQNPLLLVTEPQTRNNIMET
jgi:hypothetical protein